MIVRRLLALTVIALGLSGTDLRAGQVITFSTDQKGANTQIDSSHQTIYNFTISSPADYQIVGDFDIKRDTKTSQPIEFALYLGSNLGGNLLGLVDVAARNVSTAYGMVEFTISPSSLHLNAGNYSVVLRSETDKEGSTQYFFKSGGWQMVTSSSGGGGSPQGGFSVATPEPSTLSLAGVCFVAGGVTYWRRRGRVK